MKDKDYINDFWKKYKDTVNMTRTELLIWTKKPISRIGKTTKKAIKRNLRLLSKPKYRWTETDVKDAKRTITYIKKVKKKNRGKVIMKGMTKNDIVLMNYGFNPYK